MTVSNPDVRVPAKPLPTPTHDGVISGQGLGRVES
jgi:hypothetical protein